MSTPKPVGKILNVYHNTLGNCRYTFKGGKDANFLSGMYTTDIATEIEELDLEVASGHPHIYVDPEKLTIDTTYVDPLLEIKRKAIEEYLAAQAVAMDKTTDRGETDQNSKLQGIANTSTIADGAAESSSSDGAPIAPASATASVMIPATTAPTARIITPGK